MMNYEENTIHAGIPLLGDNAVVDPESGMEEDVPFIEEAWGTKTPRTGRVLVLLVVGLALVLSAATWFCDGPVLNALGLLTTDDDQQGSTQGSLRPSSDQELPATGDEFPGVPARRLQTEVPYECIAVLIDVQVDPNDANQDPHSYWACESTDTGLIYRITGDWVPGLFGFVVDSGDTIISVPAGSTTDHAAATIEFAGNQRPAMAQGGRGSRNRNGRNPNGRKLQTAGVAIGERTVLVVNVQLTNAVNSFTEDEFRTSVFGGNGDKVNLKSQYEACSHDQLKINRAANQDGFPNEIKDGATTVKVTTASAGQDQNYVLNEVVGALYDQHGVLPWLLADHIMFCMPKGSVDGIAFAGVGSYWSFYADDWCRSPTAQVHEIGHNLYLGHSFEFGLEYHDTSGMMGFSSAGTEGPQKCFNPAKMWQLGWFQQQSLEITPQADGSMKNVKLTSILDYDPDVSTVPVVIKINHPSSSVSFFMTLNSAFDFNQGTGDGANQVTVVRQASEGLNFAESHLEAKLDEGGSYHITNFGGPNQDVIVNVKSLVSTNAFREAVLDIIWTPDNAPPPPTGRPTGSPTKSPTDAPTSSPTTSPTKSPTAAPTSSPTTSPTKRPTDAPTSSPSTSPTKNPTDAPTSGPTTSPTKSPTDAPTSGPTTSPTRSPTDAPTISLATDSPTEIPVDAPTTSLTTDSPTESPVDAPITTDKLPTDSPTKSPTDAPGTSRDEAPTGKGSVTVTFHYNEHPEDITWTFAREGSETPLYFQPFLSNIERDSTQFITFDNLEPGEEYFLKVADAKGDGLWDPDTLAGYLSVFDEVQGITLGNVRAKFEAYYEMRFVVQANGNTELTRRSITYIRGSWDELEAMTAPNDNAYPGLTPSRPLYSLMVNMKIDSKPEDLSWVLYRTKVRDMEEIHTWDGSTATPGVMDSIELSDLARGWYRLVVKDKAASPDGGCCDFGRGYFSVMGPIEGESGEMGIVWGNYGQFKAEEAIDFRFSGITGQISHIEWEGTM